MPKNRKNSRLKQQSEDYSNIWPPPPNMPLAETPDQKSFRMMTGSKELDAFSGLFFGALPLLLLFAIIWIMMWTDYSDRISEAEIRTVLLLATAFQCLLYLKLLKVYRALLGSCLVASCLTGVYLAWIM